MMENQQAELLTSWVQVPKHSDFTIYNLPFGIFRNKRLSARVGIAIGDKIVDLSALQEAGFFQDIKLEEGVFLQDSLNPFIALGRSTTRKVREKVQQLLDENNPDLKDHQSRGKIMVGLKEAEMMLPLKIGDCTAVEEVKEYPDELRRQSNPKLFPELSQRKVSTIIHSGTSFHRPKSHIRTLDNASYEFGPTRELDFELKLAFVLGGSTKLGDTVSVADAQDYIFGMLLFNDWTARDVQAQDGMGLSYESKSFASGISHWVVTLDALEHFCITFPVQDEDLMPYLTDNKEDKGFDIQLEVHLRPEKGAEQLLCQNDFRHATWTASQLLAQQTINGAVIGIGDLIASGRVSNRKEGQYGSMMELTETGPITLEEGSMREFVQDGDTVIFKAYCEKEGIRVGFGELSNKVLPPK